MGVCQCSPRHARSSCAPFDFASYNFLSSTSALLRCRSVTMKKDAVKTTKEAPVSGLLYAQLGIDSGSKAMNLRLSQKFTYGQNTSMKLFGSFMDGQAPHCRVQVRCNTRTLVVLGAMSNMLLVERAVALETAGALGLAQVYVRGVHTPQTLREKSQKHPTPNSNMACPGSGGAQGPFQACGAPGQLPPSL